LITRSVSRTATGPFAQIRSASRTASSTARPARQHVHEPEPLGALRVERIAGERELAGDVGRERVRGAERTAVEREQAALHLGQREAGAARGDDEIAREHDLEAAAEGEPLERGDQRLGAPAPHDAVGSAALGRVLEPVAQVAARGEHVGAPASTPIQRSGSSSSWFIAASRPRVISRSSHCASRAGRGARSARGRGVRSSRASSGLPSCAAGQFVQAFTN
jgi:hypothetical protein